MRGHILFSVICGAENQVSEHTARRGKVQTLEMVTSVQAGGEVRRPAEGAGDGAGGGRGCFCRSLASLHLPSTFGNPDRQHQAFISAV